MNDYLLNEEEYIDHLVDEFIERFVCLAPLELADIIENRISRFDYEKTVYEDEERVIYRNRGIDN